VKDPERLLSGGGTAAERLLLGAGAAEEPPSGGAAHLAAMLAPPLAGPPGPSTAPPPAAPGTSGALGALGAKWAIVAAALGGAALVIATRAPEERPAPAVVAPAARTPELAAPPPEVQSPPVEQGVETSAPVENPRKRVESAAASGTPSIAREIRTLDQVRALLAKGDGRRALAELDRYRAEAPRGALGQEATLLRIEALVAAGDRPSARRLAQRFLREHPGTPHEKRVRALTGAAP
jgi:hypothetical protein